MASQRALKICNDFVAAALACFCPRRAPRSRDARSGQMPVPLASRNLEAAAAIPHGRPQKNQYRTRIELRTPKWHQITLAGPPCAGLLCIVQESTCHDRAAGAASG